MNATKKGVTAFSEDVVAPLAKRCDELAATANNILASLKEIKSILQMNDPRLGVVHSCEVDILTYPVNVLELDTRALKACHALGAHTIGQLADCTANSILAVRNVGHVTLWTLRHRLAQFKLRLRDEELSTQQILRQSAGMRDIAAKLAILDPKRK